MKKKSIILIFLRENLFSLVLFCAVLSIFLYGLQDAQTQSSQENLRIVKESVSRAIVTCYAIEGMYPSDLDYLQTEYGLYIDESRYYVQYEIFASNIMPEVTVMEVAS